MLFEEGITVFSSVLLLPPKPKAPVDVPLKLNIDAAALTSTGPFDSAEFVSVLGLLNKFGNEVELLEPKVKAALLLPGVPLLPKVKPEEPSPLPNDTSDESVLGMLSTEGTEGTIEKSLELDILMGTESDLDTNEKLLPPLERAIESTLEFSDLVISVVLGKGTVLLSSLTPKEKAGLVLFVPKENPDFVPSCAAKENAGLVSSFVPKEKTDFVSPVAPKENPVFLVL